MPKKKRQPRRPGAPRAARHLSLAAAAPSRPPLAEVEQLHHELEAWVVGVVPGLSDSEAHGFYDDVCLAAHIATEVTGLRDLGSWTPEQVRGVVRAAAEPVGSGLTDISGVEPQRAVAALAPLFGFLVDTGRWTGTPQSLAGIRQVLDEVSPAARQAQALAGVIAEPPSAPGAEDAAILAAPLGRYLLGLLRWHGPRRPVTSTGALRRADLAGAAAAVGLDLGATTVHSMWDLVRLPALWAGLRGTGLVDVGSTVSRTVLPPAVLTGDDDALAAAVAALGEDRLLVAATGVVTATLMMEGPSPWLPSPGPAAVPLLSFAATGHEVPAAAVAAAEKMGPVRPLLRELTDLGVLSAGAEPGSLVVTSGLQRVLAAPVLQLLTEVTQGLDDGLDADPSSFEEIDDEQERDVRDVERYSVTRREPPSGRALRLRVDLLDADPPVSREVLVDAAGRVGDLHQVIQAVLAWDDHHLHEFTTVTRGGKRPRGDWVSRLTPLTEALPKQGSALLYRYDLGDDWEHRITRLAVEPAPPATAFGAGSLPRCTAATGMAPHEDSGGTWGWSDHVEAANDPRHEEHEHVREWMGLRRGQRLDPTAVDLSDCERRLSLLR